MNTRTFLLLLSLVEIFTSCNSEPQQRLYAARSKYKIQKVYKNLPNYHIINATFLGNIQRNYYGNEAPDRLNLIWKTFLGSGKTRVGKDVFIWSGAGWTGQPLVVRDSNDELFIIQGTYEHSLQKIRLKDGKVVAKYFFDDVIKGTATLYPIYNEQGKLQDIIIMQGSRMGVNHSSDDKFVPSYRAISFNTMQDLWLYSSVKTDCYSRDVDGSALILRDTAYLGLENGLFMVFNPNPRYAKEVDGYKQPLVYNYDSLYFKDDIKTHSHNLVTESSPSYLNGKIYIASGSGYIFGYNIAAKKIDWIFEIGSDIDGSAVVTKDSCLIVSIEKEYIPGKGGVMKLNPYKTGNDAVEWFFPTENKNFAKWQGGVIGSASISDLYDDSIRIAAFVGIDGFLYVVKHNEIEVGQKVLCPNNKNYYNIPKLVYKYNTGPSISTPLIVQNKLIAATYNGLYLFEFDKNLNFKLLDFFASSSIEATPFVWNRRIYVASRDGYLYCFGD